MCNIIAQSETIKMAEHCWKILMEFDNPEIIITYLDNTKFVITNRDNETVNVKINRKQYVYNWSELWNFLHNMVNISKIEINLTA